MNQVSYQPARTPALPATSRGQRTREALLRAAEAVFGERGFEKSGIADIAGRAGVALGTFYIYFPDKKAIFVELVDELGQRLRRDLSDATRGLNSRLEVERAGLRAFFAFAARHRALYRIVRQAEFVDEDAFRRYYITLARGYAARLERAMEAGEIRRVDPECLAYCLMGMADFLGMRWVLWVDDEKELDAVVDQAMAFVHHGLAMQTRAATRRKKK